MSGPISAARAHRKKNDVPLLLAVGMMRTRDKLESYRVLAAAFHLLGDRPWQACAGGRWRRAGGY